MTGDPGSVFVRKIGSPKDELPICLEIRRIVFRVGMNVPEEIELDGLEDISQHFLAFYGKKPVGTCRLRTLEEGQYLKLERVAVLKEFRGQKIGQALCKAAFDFQRLENPDKLLETHAQITAVDFYNKLGMIIVSGSFYEADIEHLVMILPPRTKEERSQLNLWSDRSESSESKVIIDALKVLFE